jgi:hypothetical protein
VFFSADNTKAYVLSCGPECGGTQPASVTEIDTTSITTPASVATGTPITATVLNIWQVPGAQVGRMNTTTNMLYVAGSTGTTSVDTGGNTVLDGWYSVINLASPTTAPTTIRIGNGTSRIIRNINGVYWIGARNPGVQSGITMVNGTLTSATVLPIANGDATGITLNSNSGEVYTIEGGQLYIYDQSANVINSQYNTDIKGQGSDVLYID